jgi:hypothetical protein
MTDTTFNGWANHATWNVALWIGNDEGLYDIAREAGSFGRFQDTMRELDTLETPDHVAYNDTGIDADEMDEMIANL